MDSFIGNQPLTQAQRNVIDHVVSASKTIYLVQYTIGFIDVILNGVTLQSDEYIADDGSQIQLLSATAADDTLTTVAWGTFETASIAPNSVNEAALDVPELQAAGLMPTAWANIDGTLLGTNVPTSGFNIASVETISTGHYKITFTVAMDTTDYAIAMAVDNNNFVSTKNICHYSDQHKLTTSIEVDTFNITSGLYSVKFCIHFFGGKN